MTPKTAQKMINKKAIVYWQPKGHDRIGQYRPRIDGRIKSIDDGFVLVVTAYGDTKMTCHIEWVHECKNPEDIKFFEDQEKKYSETKDSGVL
jgi:hypothetical protein